MQTRPRFTGMNVADTPDAQLLSRAIRAWQWQRAKLVPAMPRGVEPFAKHELVRDVRSVYRWLKGENDLPQSVRERCTLLVTAARADGWHDPGPGPPDDAQ